MFAIAGTLLKRSGAYLQVFDRQEKSSPLWKDAQLAGTRWRKKLDSLRQVSVASLENAVPRYIRTSWGNVIRAAATRLAEIRDQSELTHDLLCLAFAADEACASIGVENKSNKPKERFLSTAQFLLEANKTVSFAWDVPTDTVCVLGKQHTPQRGATFRSLTHHLSLYWPNDIEARWIGPYGRGINDKAPDTVNLLLLPWPEKVATDDFRLAKDTKNLSQIDPSFFEYSPTANPSLAHFRRKFSSAINRARRHAKHLDAVVLPETALSINEYIEAEEVALREGIMLISGIRIPSARGQTVNACAIQPAGLLCPPKLRRSRSAKDRRFRDEFIERFRLIQPKHHRWCLDADQILQYQLSGVLPTLNSTWENVHLPARTLHFLTLGWWMTWSVLICEDLARQDPAADLIRAVGPNLLIALLMDGPQLRGRWPSRYASVLAEDPGTSVLTLTSLGMAERCRPTLAATRQRAPASRAIALWRDIKQGEHEIVLDGDDNACVLSLICHSGTELAADGRGDGQEAHSPVFAGYKSFRTYA